MHLTICKSCNLSMGNPIPPTSYRYAVNNILCKAARWPECIMITLMLLCMPSHPHGSKIWHSHATQNGRKKYVLRKKPPGKVLASAHAVEREYQVRQSLLHARLLPDPSSYSQLCCALTDSLPRKSCSSWQPRSMLSLCTGVGSAAGYQCPRAPGAVPRNRQCHHWHALLCHGACAGECRDPHLLWDTHDVLGVVK